jgi:hypothetical protein
MVGGLSIFCGMIWGGISDRLGRSKGSALAYLVLALSYIIYAAIKVEFGIYLSAIVFGLTAWSIPTIMAAAAGDYVGPRLAPAGLGFITLFFGVRRIPGRHEQNLYDPVSGSRGYFFNRNGAVFLSQKTIHHTQLRIDGHDPRKPDQTRQVQNHPPDLKLAVSHCLKDLPAGFIEVIWQPPFYRCVGHGHDDIGPGTNDDTRLVWDTGMNRHGSL